MGSESKVLRRLRVAYNDCFRCLHGIPRFCIAHPGQVAVNIDTFDPLIGIFLHAANGPVTDMDLSNRFLHIIFFNIAEVSNHNILLIH